MYVCMFVYIYGCIMWVGMDECMYVLCRYVCTHGWMD